MKLSNICKQDFNSPSIEAENHKLMFPLKISLASYTKEGPFGRRPFSWKMWGKVYRILQLEQLYNTTRLLIICEEVVNFLWNCKYYHKKCKHINIFAILTRHFNNQNPSSLIKHKGLRDFYFHRLTEFWYFYVCEQSIYRAKVNIYLHIFAFICINLYLSSHLWLMQFYTYLYFITSSAKHKIHFLHRYILFQMQNEPFFLLNRWVDYSI